MYAIQTHDLTKIYGKKHAVDHLNMTVHEGDIYGFVGNNGVGKSTTMKMIAGLASPTWGEIELYGQLIGAHPARGNAGGVNATQTHHVGALIEEPGVLKAHSAFDNLMMKALAIGVINPKEHCRDLLKLVGLADTGSQPAKKFSLGMKQRLGLALALVGTPDLLLLDEPFNGMDPQATRDMRQALVRLNRERGVTIVISSHVLDQLNRMATRYGVVRDGALVREITEAQVHESCGSSVRIKTADPARTLAILEERLPGANLRALPDQAISISLPSLVPAASAPAAPAASATSSSSATDPAPAAQAVEHISRILHDADQVVLELSVTERDIEDYFVELMGTPAPKYPPPARSQPLQPASVARTLATYTRGRLSSLPLSRPPLRKVSPCSAFSNQTSTASSTQIVCAASSLVAL